jgi:hypothetical protein
MMTWVMLPYRQSLELQVIPLLTSGLHRDLGDIQKFKGSQLWYITHMY